MLNEFYGEVPANCSSKHFVCTVRGLSPCNQSLRVKSSVSGCTKQVRKSRTSSDRFRPYLSMQPKSLERAVVQASHGLICDTASLSATSEHVRHCWNNQRKKISNLRKRTCALKRIDPQTILRFSLTAQQGSPTELHIS